MIHSLPSKNLTVLFAGIKQNPNEILKQTKPNIFFSSRLTDYERDLPNNKPSYLKHVWLGRCYRHSNQFIYLRDNEWVFLSCLRAHIYLVISIIYELCIAYHHILGHADHENINKIIDENLIFFWRFRFLCFSYVYAEF